MSATAHRTLPASYDTVEAIHAPQVLRAFRVSECAPGIYHVTCWNEDVSSCGVFTAYDHDLAENIAALEARGRVNMTGYTYDHQQRQWVKLYLGRPHKGVRPVGGVA